MLLKIVLVLLIQQLVFASKSSKQKVWCLQDPIKRLYQELDCDPIYGSIKCPMYYECHDRWEYECDGDDSGPSCIAVLCVRPPDNCVPVHNLKQCCPTSFICDPQEIEDRAYCYVEGKEYRAGDVMVPKNGCVRCLCHSGFNNSTIEASNPYCEPTDCDLLWFQRDQLSQGCAPIYCGNEGCCPIGWRCYKPTDFNGTIDVGQEDTTVDYCTYGDVKVPVGSYLNPYTEEDVEFTKDIVCKCTTPPFVTCIQNNDCDL